MRQVLSSNASLRLLWNGIDQLPWGYTGSKYRHLLLEDRQKALEAGFVWFGPNGDGAVY
jgi:hypothetical protein